MLVLWDKLNGKKTTKLLEIRYFAELLQFTTAMFDWDLPESLDAKFLEKYLNANGIFGVIKKQDGTYLAGMGGTTGKLDQYGIGNMFEGDTLGADYVNGKIGDDVAICWHNSAHTPNLDIARTASTLAEYDKSIYRIVQMSRASPIFAARDDTVKNAITDAKNKIIDGDIVCVASDNVLQNYQTGEPLSAVHITDPRYSEYLQFLNEGKDAEYKRYYQKYGHAMQASSKHTTTLIDELHGADSVSFVVPMDMLDCRKKFCETATAIFGDKFDVKFSDLWATEFVKYKAENEESDFSKRLENPEESGDENAK